jgi:hypothetical protein
MHVRIEMRCDGSLLAVMIIFYVSVTLFSVGYEQAGIGTWDTATGKFDAEALSLQSLTTTSLGHDLTNVLQIVSQGKHHQM